MLKMHILEAIKIAEEFIAKIIDFIERLSESKIEEYKNKFINNIREL